MARRGSDLVAVGAAAVAVTVAMLVAWAALTGDRTEERLVSASATIGDEPPSSPDLTARFRADVSREAISRFATELSGPDSAARRAARSMYADYEAKALLITLDGQATVEQVRSLRAALEASALIEAVDGRL